MKELREVLPPKSILCFRVRHNQRAGRKRSSIIAVSRFYHVKLQTLFIYLQNCLHQNAGAIRHIRRCCKFFWRVADFIDAWSEDHSDWNDSRKILSIVPCAAWCNDRIIPSNMKTNLKVITVALTNSLEFRLTSKRVSAGIASTNESSNHSSCYSSIVCDDSGMFCSEPADGHVETQRGKIEIGARNGQEHDCHLLAAGG